MTTYERRGQEIVIKDGFEPEIVLDIPSLGQVIATIKANQENYATEDAYQVDLAKYQAVLLYAERLA